MIKIKYVKGDLFVYNIEDWRKLRISHRIVGQIIGSTTFLPSLPAKLLPEEAVLLLDKDLAEVLEATDSRSSNINQSNNFEEAFLREQQLEYKKVRKVQLESLIDKIVEKRHSLGDNRSKDEIFHEELEKSSSVTKDNMIWPIFLEDDTSNFTSVPYETVSSLTTPLKSAIYKDLWERGYYITNGEKFGGDFLVYFGDPICHHAIFIVKCIDEEKTFSPTDLIAFGRLGVAVKKRAVLGSFKDGKVSYLTINWIDA